MKFNNKNKAVSDLTPHGISRRTKNNSLQKLLENKRHRYALRLKTLKVARPETAKYFIKSKNIVKKNATLFKNGLRIKV